MPDLSLDLVKKRFESAKKVAEPKFADFQRWEDWRKCILPKEFRASFSGKDSGRPALVPPLVRTCLHDLRAKTVNSIFSIKPHFELTDKRYPQEILEKNQNLLMFQFEQEPLNPRFRYRAKVAKQVYDFLTYGIGIKACIWRRFENPLTGEIYEGAGFENVPPYRFYPSPYWDTNGNLAYYFIQSVVHYQELVEKAEMGLLDGEAVNTIQLERFQEIKSKVEHYAKDVDFNTLDLKKEADKMICPVLVWNYVDKNNRIVVANEKTIIKQVENLDKSPNLGLSILNLGNDDGEFYGESSVDFIEDNFIEKFHKRNQRLTAQDLSVGGQHITDDPNAPPMFETAPGKIHKVSMGRIENYKELKFTDGTDKGLIEENLVTKETKESLGLSDVFMGQSPERREAATTQLILQQNASSDLTFTISEIEDAVVIVDVLLMLSQNAQKFPVNPPPAYRGLDINQRDIIASCHVRPLGITQAISRPVLASQITGLMEQWKTIPQIADDVEWREFAQRQLVALQFPDPEKFFKDPTQKLIPITKENYLIAQGVQVPVDPDEDHLFHDKNHEAFERSGMLPPQFWDLMQIHRQEHQGLAEQQMPPQAKGKLLTNEGGVVKRLSGESQPQRGSPREETI